LSSLTTTTPADNLSDMRQDNPPAGVGVSLMPRLVPQQ
jgi:hypothetical protein